MSTIGERIGKIAQDNLARIARKQTNKKKKPSTTQHGSCERKQAFNSEGAAEAAIRSLLKRGLAKDADTIHHYPCGRCFKIHIGHDKNKGENKR